MRVAAAALDLSFFSTVAQTVVTGTLPTHGEVTWQLGVETGLSTIAVNRVDEVVEEICPVMGLDAAAKANNGVEIGLGVIAAAAIVAAEIDELEEAAGLGVAPKMFKVGRTAGLEAAAGVGAGAIGTWCKALLLLRSATRVAHPALALFVRNPAKRIAAVAAASSPGVSAARDGSVAITIAVSQMVHPK
uniref:Uncharacterized protein n=1 Tax=Oryza brachyantha TaxID=4533 RepID=J3ND07_ORYBR